MAPPPFQFRGNGPPPREGNRRARRDQGKGGPKDRRPRQRPEFTFRAPRPTSERPLLSGKRETTPEQLQSVEAGEKAAPKFASLDALSDSEEAEMDFSEDSEEEARPRKKRAFGLDGNNSPKPAPAPAPTPKWSNPDPYTALPPPDDSQHKRIDMVKLIRKARLATVEQPKKNDAVVQNEDFISLGGLDGSHDDGKSEAEDESTKAPQNAPKGPKGLEARITAPKGPKAMGGGDAVPAKRTLEAQLKGNSLKLGMPKRKFNTSGSVVHDWMPSSSQDSAPWMDGVQPVMQLSSR